MLILLMLLVLFVLPVLGVILVVSAAMEPEPQRVARRPCD
jgi:hypothetical protein